MPCVFGFFKLEEDQNISEVHSTQNQGDNTKPLR